MLIHHRVALRRTWFALSFGILVSICLFASPAGGQTPWDAGFAQPPETSKPWCYWYWISDNISKPGITRDLEAMARVGIGEAFIGNVFFDDTPSGDVKVLSDAWWEIVEHAIREGGRLGVDIGMFNCPGWSQSGGPWIEPEDAMRYLVASETHVQGPQRLTQWLPVPQEPFQDVAVLAFPAPQHDALPWAELHPHVACEPAVPTADHLVDGRSETSVVFPAGAGRGAEPVRIAITLAQPLTVRSLTLTPADTAWAAQVELQATDETGSFQTVRRFTFDRSNMELHVGPLPRGPVCIACEPVTAQRFQIVLTGVTGTVGLAEIELSAAARLESYIEKQLGKMHPTPLPMWDTYLWPAQPEPDQPSLVVAPAQVVNLTEQMAADGTLHWDVPPGPWVILRTGMTTTGTRNSPASPEGSGLEVDKMNRRAAARHFEAFIGEILRRMPPQDRRALKHVVADSYEMGSQNWTDQWATTFQQRYGYSPLPWLPALTGRVVGSAEQSDRFLWDLRRLVADRIATEYVGGLRDLCRPHGLQLWLENYGHWGFPAEFLQYGGQSDRIGGEFWVTGSLGSIECRAASSAGNIYGFPVVSAEAFTGGPLFQTVPSATKARGDWAFCEGINHFVLHVCIHQPWEDRWPGMNAWFGTEFNRHNTWFDASRDWVTYLRRCSFLLQQGTRVADVAYFIGEDTPKMTGVRRPELPPGYDFDYINAEVIESTLSVRDQLLVLPHGTAYRVLVLPELSTMRPELLRKIRDLVVRGATVLGPPPSRSPSLENYPACDQEVRALAAELWGPTTSHTASGDHVLGRGRVVWGRSLQELLPAAGTPPDFESDVPLLYTHRATPAADVYFVSNQSRQPVLATGRFRVGGRAPELWDPVSGRIHRTAMYDTTDSTTCVPLQLGPQGSVFVVFREPVVDADRIVAVRHEGNTLVDLRAIASTDAAGSTGAADEPDPTKSQQDLQRPQAAGSVELTRPAPGQLEATVWQPGRYEVQAADGTVHPFRAESLPAALTLTGPWEVRFDPQWGGPERTVFEQLSSWTDHQEDGIRHYSGTATYHTTFQLPVAWQGQPLRLDLGDVRDLAVVRLNGKSLGTHWLAPWHVDITQHVQTGENRLELDVINPWNNRLVGDLHLPPERRRTFVALNVVKADTPLLPAGLLGPVTIHVAHRVSVP